MVDCEFSKGLKHTKGAWCDLVTAGLSDSPVCTRGPPAALLMNFRPHLSVTGTLEASPAAPDTLTCTAFLLLWCQPVSSSRDCSTGHGPPPASFGSQGQRTGRNPMISFLTKNFTWLLPGRWDGGSRTSKIHGNVLLQPKRMETR